MVSPAVGKVILVPFPFSDLHVHCPLHGAHTSRHKPAGRMRHPRTSGTKVAWSDLCEIQTNYWSRLFGFSPVV
jgi:hypothetical protein